MKTRPIQPPPVRCAQCRRKLPKGTEPHPGLLCIDCHVEDFKGPDGKDVLEPRNTTAGDTVTVGTTTITFVSKVTEPGQVLIGGSLVETMRNFNEVAPGLARLFTPAPKESAALARLRARHEEKMAALRGVAAALGMDWGPVLDEATRRVVAYAKRPDYVDALEELRKDMLAGTWAPK